MATVVATMELRETELKKKQQADLENVQAGEVGGSFEDGAVLGPPTNPMVSSLLTDMYQISMAYAYLKAGKHKDRAVYVSKFGFILCISWVSGFFV